MGVEAVSRLGLCATALVFQGWGKGLLAAALCLPLVLSGLVGRVLARRLANPAGDPLGATHAREQGSITSVSVFIQVVLSSAPLAAGRVDRTRPCPARSSRSRPTCGSRC